MLHWYPFPAFYQEFLNLGATLMAIHKKQFLAIYEMSQDLTFLMNTLCR